MLEFDFDRDKAEIKQTDYKSGVRFEGEVKGAVRTGNGCVHWPDGSRYEGEFKDNKRSGKGKYFYSNGSVYVGDFDDDMRHGDGELTHPNGEVYKGQFVRDSCHGIGSYIWSEEEKIYTGLFYRNRMHGYGILSFASGDKYEGMMRDNDRFGPGIFCKASTTDAGPNEAIQDVGLWLGPALYRLCFEIPCSFSLRNYQHLCPSDSGWLKPAPICLSDDMEDQMSTIRPILQSMETYRGSLDVSRVIPRVFLDHSVDSKSLAFDRSCFDLAFFGGGEQLERVLSRGSDSWVTPPNTTDAYVAMLRLASHFENHESLLSFSPKAVFTASNRSVAGGSSDNVAERGCREVMSTRLIEAAREGDVATVLDLFLDTTTPLHPDVCDCRGNGALINAAVGGHLDMVDTLLNNGCNSNVLNDECVTPLLACFTLFYPATCFKQNIAEYPPGMTRFIAASLTSQQSRKGGGSTGNHQTGRRSRSTSPVRQQQQRSAASSSTTTTARNKDKRTPSPIKAPTTTGEHESAAEPGGGVGNKSGINKTRKRAVKGRGQGTKEGEETAKKEAKNQTFDSPPQTPSFEAVGVENVENSQQSLVNVAVGPLPPRVLERAATLLSENEYITGPGRSATKDDLLGQGATSGSSKPEDAVRGRALQIAQHRQIGHVIELLLRRGANVNAGLNPMPCLLFAVRSADVDMTKRLLLAGADANVVVRVGVNAGGGQLASLHIAAGLPGHEGVQITTHLLNALASANARAQLTGYFLSNTMLARMVATSASSSPPATTSGDRQPLIELIREEWEHDPLPSDALRSRCGGPTPLHIACARDDDYLVAAHVVRMLLEHKADPDVICQGHSPLSLAIASGNDLAVDLLLSFGCNASLPLTDGNGSALCVATNPDWERRRLPSDRLKLLDKLVAAGANAMAPVLVGPKRHTGTFVDFAYHMYNQDRRIAHTPFHALTAQERDTHTARKELLNHCGDLLRTAVVGAERQRNRAPVGRSRSPSGDFVHVGGGAEVHGSKKEWKKSPLPVRRPALHYCYQCGRSVGVRLTPCTRCKEVYYCSKNCKLASWNIRHKDECMRVEAGTRGSSRRAESPTPAVDGRGDPQQKRQPRPAQRILVPSKGRSNSLDDLRASVKKLQAASDAKQAALLKANAENNYSYN